MLSAEQSAGAQGFTTAGSNKLPPLSNTADDFHPEQQQLLVNINTASTARVAPTLYAQTPLMFNALGDTLTCVNNLVENPDALTPQVSETMVDTINCDAMGQIPNTIGIGAGVYTGTKPIATTIGTGVYTGAKPIVNTIETGASVNPGAKSIVNTMMPQLEQVLAHVLVLNQLRTLHYKSTHGRILNLNMVLCQCV